MSLAGGEVWLLEVKTLIAAKFKARCCPLPDIKPEAHFLHVSDGDNYSAPSQGTLGCSSNLITVLSPIPKDGSLRKLWPPA